jgi:hypothetical protein
LALGWPGYCSTVGVMSNAHLFSDRGPAVWTYVHVCKACGKELLQRHPDSKPALDAQAEMASYAKAHVCDTGVK